MRSDASFETLDRRDAETQRRRDAETTDLSSEHNRISGVVVDAAFAVHSALGPGLLESVYELCLASELAARGVKSEREVSVPIVYRDRRINAGYRIDLLVEELVLVEIKAVERLLPLHEAQLLTYLKLSARHLGLLINSNVPVIKAGIRRLIRSN